MRFDFFLVDLRLVVLILGLTLLYSMFRLGYLLGLYKVSLWNSRFGVSLLFGFGFGFFLAFGFAWGGVCV